MKSIIEYLAGRVRLRAVAPGHLTPAQAQKWLLDQKRPCYRVFSVKHI